MRLRTLRLWKKYKLVWLALLGWTIMGAAALFLLGYNVLDLRGGLPKIQPLYEEKVALEQVEEIVVQAEGVRLEMAESYHVKELTIQLYGSGYQGQSVAWQEKAGKLEIYYRPYPITANAYGLHSSPEVVLRLIFPTEQYRKVTVQGDWLEGEFRQLEAELLDLQIAHGHILVVDGCLDRLKLTTTDALVNLQDNQIIHFTLNNLAGDSILYNNKLTYWLYDSQWGNLDAWQKDMQGHWQLNNRWGNIALATKKVPADLLLDVWTEKGSVEIGYDEDEWENMLDTKYLDGHLQAKVGQGKNILTIENREGQTALYRDKKRFIYEE